MVPGASLTPDQQSEIITAQALLNDNTISSNTPNTVRRVNQMASSQNTELDGESTHVADAGDGYIVFVSILAVGAAKLSHRVPIKSRR